MRPEGDARTTARALFAILCYQGYAFSILGLAAPFIGKTFALDQTGIARMFADIVEVLGGEQGDAILQAAAA